MGFLDLSRGRDGRILPTGGQGAGRRWPAALLRATGLGEQMGAGGVVELHERPAKYLLAT